MSLALFITHPVSTTVIDRALDEGLCLGYPSFFIAEREDVCPLERWSSDTAATKTPIPSTWRSNFLGYTPEQCATFLKALVPEAVGENYNEIRNRRRFAILDERFTQSGELLGCDRGEDDSVTSLRMEPAMAASCLDIWYSDQWEDSLRLQAQHEASVKQYVDQQNSRKAALARHFRDQEAGK